MRVGQKLRKLRLSRAARTFPVSTFTIFLIIFSLVFWVTNLWVTLTIPGNFCHWADFWLDGWFEHRSLLQLFIVIIAATTILFVIRLIYFRRLNLYLVEVTAQGLLILWLAFVVFGLKSWLLPNASPTFYTMQVIFRITSPPPIQLVEEMQTSQGYEFSAPPVDPYPGFLPTPDMIFSSEKAPLWSEYQEMKSCRAKTDNYMREYALWRESLQMWVQEECVLGKCPRPKTLE